MASNDTTAVSYNQIIREQTAKRTVFYSEEGYISKKTDTAKLLIL